MIRGEEMKSKFVKAVAGVSLSALVATSCVTSASAKDNSSTIYDSGTGYIAEKITHPEKGVMTTDGIVDYIGNGNLLQTLRMATEIEDKIIHGVQLAMEIICILEPVMVHGHQLFSL